MIGKRLLGVAGAGVLVSCLGVLAACSGADEGKPSAAETFRSANVAITLHDTNGAAVGDGAGILIAPRVVLTSAHLVAGKAKWTVRAADGTVATGTKGLTKDWMVYNSMKAHPRLNDVAVIYLDKAIDLPAYPKLASSHVKMGAEALRVHRDETGFATTTAKLERLSSFPNAYVTDIAKSETLSTGGAVVNENFEIVGLVTGRGLTTGKLYIARTDKLLAWLSPKVTCNAGKKIASSLSVRTYGAPPPKPDCDGGTGGSSSGGSSSGGSSSGGTGGNDGTTSSGGTNGSSGGGSSGGSGDLSCDDGGGIGYPSNPDGSGSGSDGSSSGGSSSGGTGGNDGTTSSSGGSSSGGSSSGGTGGNDGTTSSSGGSSSGGTGGNDGTTSSGGSGSGSGSDNVPDACTGPDNNPEICPPEETGCFGPNCGGGTPDDFIDYGKCACTTTSSTGSVIIR